MRKTDNTTPLTAFPTALGTAVAGCRVPFVVFYMCKAVHTLNQSGKFTFIGKEISCVPVQIFPEMNNRYWCFYKLS